MVKNFSKNDDKYKDIIIKTIIFSSVIISLLGIDYMTTRFFPDILENIGLPYVINIENRMFASLGYANSFAIILAISVILTFNQMNSKKDCNAKFDCVYSGVLFLNISCIFLSYSRTVLILLAIFLIAYLIINKNKRIYKIYILGIDVILSLIYLMFWKSVLIWIITILMLGISCLAKIFIDKIYNRIEKITKKTYAIIIIVGIIGMLIFVGIGINLTRPLIIFKPNSSNEMVKYKIQNVLPNTEYILKFNIDAKSTLKNIENYKITVSEENKYYDTVEEHEITFNNYEGIKEIKFITNNETIELAIYIESEYKAAQLGLTIKSFTINGKEHPLKYLYLPVSIVDKIKDINLEDKSVWEREAYYKDAFKIIKNDFLTGLGANAWKYKYKEVQQYNYSSTEVHSFPIQVLLENGIISIILLFIIIIYIIIKLIKNIKANRNNLEIFLALILLILHSFVDFDMSFYYIMMLFFTLIGFLPQDYQKVNNNNKNKIVTLLLLTIFLLVDILGIKNLLFSNYSKRQIMYFYYNKGEYDKTVNEIKKMRMTEKYNNYEEIYMEIDYSKISDENLEYIYEDVINMPLTVNVEYDMNKNRIIEKIINTSKNEKIKIIMAQIIIDENDKYIEIIQDKEKNRLTNKEIKSYLNEQEKIYKLALKYID